MPASPYMQLSSNNVSTLAWRIEDMKSGRCSCNICGMVFINEKELAKHSSLVHAANNDEKMFQCQSCSKFFDSKEEYENHIIFHIKSSGTKKTKL
jgi:uncharacterized C2H2 Zn-finger protein